MSICIITDTLCDVPKYYIEKHNIKVMPLKVHFGEESFLDGIDITNKEFFDRLVRSDELPTTSQVTPMEFTKVFTEELEKGNTIIAIMGSSELSGTHDSAFVTMQEMKNDRVYVIDSKSITLGAGLLVIKAARLVEEGKAAREIVEIIENTKKTMKHFLVIGNLKYLYKGGRISLSESVIGSILNIKPIVILNDGKLEMIEKTRGIKKAISATINMIEENGYTLNNKTIGINHTVAKEYADYLEEVVKKSYTVKEIIRGEVGSVIGTHGGPGCIGFYFDINEE